MQLRSLIAVCAVLLVLFAALAFWSRYGREPGAGVEGLGEPGEAGEEQGSGLIVVKPPAGVGEKDEAGNWMWEAQFAGELKVDQKAGTVTGSQVTCTIPLAGDHTVVVTARSFRADQRARRLRFEEQARAELKPLGSYFLADAFDWAVDVQRLSAVGGVELRHEHLMVTGDNLDADLAARTARVSGHPKATYRG